MIFIKSCKNIFGENLNGSLDIVKIYYKKIRILLQKDTTYAECIRFAFRESVRIRGFSGPYFPTFGLNADTPNVLSKNTDILDL